MHDHVPRLITKTPRGHVLTPQEVDAFHKTVYSWYHVNGRSLPWRNTVDPYAILVSEIMLQQTRVDRVIVKYAEFLGIFPDFGALAAAPLPEVLCAWQGLGYNRRAIALKQCAEAVVARFSSELPDSAEALQSLPGIGPYTARAVIAFAFGKPTVFIETNIRAVFIHHFCGDRTVVNDRELLPLVAATVDAANPRLWYNALMDYGVMVKRIHGNPARRSAHHVRQSSFRGSNRELRSRILKLLLTQPAMSREDLAAALSAGSEAVGNNLAAMEKEGFVVTEGEICRVRVTSD